MREHMPVNATLQEMIVELTWRCCPLLTLKIQYRAGLLYKSQKAIETFLSCQPDQTHEVRAVGLAAFSANQTEDGKSVFLISPVDVLLQATGVA